MKNEKTTEEKISSVKETYHFAGGGEYEPIAIEASSIEEATKEWERKRAPVNGEELSVDN